MTFKGVFETSSVFQTAAMSWDDNVSWHWLRDIFRNTLRNCSTGAMNSNISI